MAMITCIGKLTSSDYCVWQLEYWDPRAKEVIDALYEGSELQVLSTLEDELGWELIAVGGGTFISEFYLKNDINKLSGST